MHHSLLRSTSINCLYIKIYLEYTLHNFLDDDPFMIKFLENSQTFARHVHALSNNNNNNKIITKPPHNLLKLK